MQRDVSYDLSTWKDDKNRKPLIITGARQCGKTYIMKEFGKAFFESVAYVNFAENEMAGSAFDYDYDVKRVIHELSVLSGTEIIPGNTLLILDDIQECPRAIAALKYFNDKMVQLHVICAGRFLEQSLAKLGLPYPVGKVGRLRMRPLSFLEFLFASGNEELVGLINGFPNDRPLASSQLRRLDELYTTYTIVGGMPEAVSSWIEYHDYKRVDMILDTIIDLCRGDFDKYASRSDAKKLGWIWDSIPKQLVKENNKFMYSQVKPGKRSHELENALKWLLDSGLVYSNYMATAIKLPLTQHADKSYFKIYFADVGLLRRSCDVSAQSILSDSPIFDYFKRGFRENYVFNELTQYGFKPHFWRSSNTAEIDFLIEKNSLIVPVDVRSADNTMAKNYRLFCKRFGSKLGFKIYRKNIAINTVEGTRTISLPVSLIWRLASF